MPLISVIVPVYKVEPYLCRCVDSILAQTFTDFELILVDDGSPDNCGAICDDYAAKDKRIHVIHQKNGGLSAARNAGIDWSFAHSDSQWLSFVDSDDWVHEQYLEKLYEAAIQTGSGASSCLYSRVLPNGEELDYPTTEKEREVLDFDSFFSITGWSYTPYTAWAKLYGKELFTKIRFPVGKLNEDLFTTHKALFFSGTIARVNKVMYYYFQSDQSIMRKSWVPQRLDEVRASEKLIDFMKKNGCEHASSTALKRYYWVLNAQIKDVRDSRNDSYTKYEKRLKRKRKLLLATYGNIVAPLKDNLLLYRKLFPKVSWMYWTGVGIKNKIKRIVKKDANN